MLFENHTFISYAHIDNVKAPDDEMGWVTHFAEYLKVSLTLGLGENARIWRDDKLQGNDVFGPEIEAQLEKTAVLVSIISKRYLESKWCVKEVNEFCAIAEEHGGLKVDNKARVFRVLMRSIDYKKLRVFDDLKDSALSYPFYTEISVDNSGKGGRREIRLDPRYGHGQAFRLNIELLSDEIVTLIEKLEEEMGEADLSSAEVSGSGEKPTVYLADCAYDLRPERDRIVAELRKHGYAILPDERLPELESEYVEAVQRLLDRCKLSIHLVGSAYGSVPDGPSGKSTVELQNEAAVAAAKKTGLKRLIWSPSHLEPQGDDQTAFVKLLHSDATAQFGADLITADIETLKSAMHETLKALTVSKPVEQENQRDESVQKIVYVLCDSRDRKVTIPLRKYLMGKGYDVIIPVFIADSAKEIRKANEQQLQDCDAVILWYGEGDEAWRATMESDLRRSKGTRSGRPLTIFTYIAGPLTDDKDEMVLTEEPNLINGLDIEDVSEALMADFESEIEG